MVDLKDAVLAMADDDQLGRSAAQHLNQRVIGIGGRQRLRRRLMSNAGRSTHGRVSSHEADSCRCGDWGRARMPHLTKALRARTPSFHVIFFPSSYPRPV